MKQPINILYRFVEVFHDEMPAIDHCRNIRQHGGARRTRCNSTRGIQASDKRTHEREQGQILVVRRGTEFATAGRRPLSIF